VAGRVFLDTGPYVPSCHTDRWYLGSFLCYCVARQNLRCSQHGLGIFLLVSIDGVWSDSRPGDYEGRKDCSVINIDKWVAGYKVRAFDWVDGENIYLHIEYNRPGASLSKPPAVEKSFLIPREEEVKVRNFLHSIVIGLMEPRSSMAD